MAKIKNQCNYVVSSYNCSFAFGISIAKISLDSMMLKIILKVCILHILLLYLFHGIQVSIATLRLVDVYVF